MDRIQNSPLVSLVALAVACFSTGFSLTAAAYIGRAQRPAVEPASATANTANTALSQGRTCDQPVATR
ncbi:MAG TPA: hypothetical protein VGK73_34155 [Polyangiaceae bacterium]